MVQADSGVHEEAIINHHGGIFLHLFGVVLSRWGWLDHVGAGDVGRTSEPWTNVPVLIQLCFIWEMFEDSMQNRSS